VVELEGLTAVGGVCHCPATPNTIVSFGGTIADTRKKVSIQAQTAAPFWDV